MRDWRIRGQTHLSYLQPFEDVNKRASRLAANIPLIQRNLCLLSFVDASQTVVREKLSKPRAISHIHRFAQGQIEAPDRERFIEVVETQLLSLHEGKIARYRLRPSEFHAWREVWKKIQHPHRLP